MFADLRCFLLFFVAVVDRCCSFFFLFLLMSTTFHRSTVEANEWKSEWKMLFVAFCCSSLLVLVFARVFGVCFHLPFVAFCCSSLFVVVFEIESVLSQKPKQANAFGCSFWLFVARFGFLKMFAFELRIVRFDFLFVWITKTSNKRPKSPNGHQVKTEINGRFFTCAFGAPCCWHCSSAHPGFVKEKFLGARSSVVVTSFRFRHAQQQDG